MPNQEITLKVINDPDCVVCDTTQIITTLRTLMPEIQVSYLNVNSGEAQTIIQNNKVQSLPVLIFNEAIKNAEAYSQLKNYLVQMGNNYILRIDGNMILTKTESQNPKIDLFVFSTEERSISMENNLKELYENFKNQVEFNIHFITYSRSMLEAEQETYCLGDYCSPKGVEEVMEDLRQSCIIHYYPDTWYDYITQRNQDINGTWQTPANNLGMNTTLISECANSSQGQELLEEKTELSRELGIMIGPTIIINDVYRPQSNNPEYLKSVICYYHENLNGCSIELTNSS